MPFGTYKPYFHGELVTEYRNSLSKIKAQSNGETGKGPAPDLEVYTEPSKRTSLLSVKFTITEVHRKIKTHVVNYYILNFNYFLRYDDVLENDRIGILNIECRIYLFLCDARFLAHR